jgi:hypothetical protein
MTTPKPAKTWLDRIAEVPRRCSAKPTWDEMAGSEAPRFCDQFQKSMMNLSEITAAEAEARLWDVYRTSGEVPCVTFVLDEDDRMIVEPDARRPWRIGHPARLLALESGGVALREPGITGHTALREGSHLHPRRPLS